MRLLVLHLSFLVFLAMHVVLFGQDAADRSPAETAKLKQAVVDAFAKTHDGWSTDEVLIRDNLRNAFIEECAQSYPKGQPAEFAWTLLNLRKANQLTVKATRRQHVDDDNYRHAAEIAVRSLQDRHEVSLDRIISDPAMLADFDELARSLAGDNVTAWQLRKSALKLRKARQLRPELILRIADWGREITTTSVSAAVENMDQISESPGIYMFFDDSGYLYIGESANLRKRLRKHLDESDRAALAGYLSEHDSADISIEIHAFDPDSQAKSKPVRRAYESELIRSRKPRLNLAP